jgi:murein DD-endopeptidase MepM/ murein hydrolase activator NlpD
MRPRGFRPRKAVVLTAAAATAIALVSQPVIAAVSGTDDAKPAPNHAAASDNAAAAAVAYRLPLRKRALPRREYDDPHHDYPAIDLPVPSGTRAYAVTSGRAAVFTDAGCGKGVQLTGDNGAVYTYCHFRKHSIRSGRVGAGKLIGRTGNTGNSSGPHLHFQIRTPDGRLRCPQRMLLALYDGRRPPRPGNLPTSGCFFQSLNPQAPLGPSPAG